MSREDHVSKGRRYVAEGRLTITRVQLDHVTATCRGSGAIWRCGHAPNHGWWCDCPAKSECAHISALQLVVVVPGTPQPRRGTTR